MASEALDVADACPTKDFVAALLEYLVDPKLPGKSSAKGDISQTAQESIAKQVHAIFLLYNYYHRKQHPQLEFLCFESFCKLPVVANSALLAHMRLLQRSNDTESQPFSLIEETILEACSIAMSLDALGGDLNIDGWPISKVAVLLVDSRKENCFLQFGSITHGVWSVIEKDVDVSNDSLEGAMDSDHVNKKKRIIKNTLNGKLSTNGAAFQQFAFSAVKEKQGIDERDLVVLESHVTYSTSKEKTAAYFYIMQFTKADNSITHQIPIKNVINSLQGPLAAKNASCWMHTSVVEYFHLLPYAKLMSDWLASAAELSGSETTTQSLKHNDNIGYLGSEINSSKQNDNDKGCVVDLSEDFDMTQKMDIDESFVAHTQKKCKRRNVCSKDQSQNCQKKTNTGDKCLKGSASKKIESVEKCLKGSTTTSGDKADMVGQTTSQIITGCMGAAVANGNKKGSASKKIKTMEKCLEGSLSGDKVKADMVGQTPSQKITGCTGAVLPNGNENCNNIVENLDRIPATDHPVVAYQSNSNNLHKLQTILASKDKELSDAALTVVLSKRDKLSLQQRDIEDQISQCDKDIETILKGGEDSLSLKIESLIEGCNHISLRSVSRGGVYEDQCLSPSIKRKRLANTVPNTKPSCQELDDICYENNWILPTYHVSSQDGGFRADVTVKGTEFECSSGGELCPRPREARESAAKQMLAKLRNMPHISW